jgi:hypothetical protein
MDSGLLRYRSQRRLGDILRLNENPKQKPRLRGLCFVMGNSEDFSVFPHSVYYLRYVNIISQCKYHWLVKVHKRKKLQANAAAFYFIIIRL